AWMRTLGGTSSLRALVYFDEIFGHFPPYPKNPPTKEPLLRLLKQARAFGIGMVLATQNPGDLDYKGLSNAGTWYIGKLQTENDKKKVLDGLATASTASNPIDLSRMDTLLSTINPRVFVLNNIHDAGGPILMHTRWAMCYLAGPLTRTEVSALMTPQKQYTYPGGQIPQPYASQPPYTQSRTAAPSLPPQSLPGFADAPPSLPAFSPPPSLPEVGQQPTGFGAPPPIPTGYSAPQYISQQPYTPSAPVSVPQPQQQDTGLPPGFSTNPPSITSDIVQFFLPSNINLQQSLSFWERTNQRQAYINQRAVIAYRPFLLVQCQVRYMDRKFSVNTVQTYAYHVFGVERSGLIHWDEHVALPVDRKSLLDKPYEQVIYAELPSGLTDKKRLTALEKEAVDYLYQTAAVTLLANETLGI
ncbi:MAG: hypothetical protein K8I82_21090, partial [Anaerolineae bacterium]|nr:hypothetical protein [Anaerolineae bacterium]